jgi:hypothetical protein
MQTSPAETSAPVAPPPVSGFDEPAAEPGPRRGMPLREERPREMAPARTQPAAYSSDRSALFHGEQVARGREFSPAPSPPPSRRPAERQDRSLDAVFSRLSGPRERGPDRDRLPDPRNRSRTSPGLGGVFDRLR